MKTPITIYMADLVHDILPGIYVVPLNVSGISAYIKSVMGGEVEIRIFKSPPALLAAIKKKPPQILALSNYLWNRHLNSQIGKIVRTHFPEVIIAAGGPGIRIDREGIGQFLRANSYIDIYTLFEGEQPFLNFMQKTFGASASGHKRAKERFADGDIIKGCAYSVGEDLIYSEHDILSDLGALPSPYLTGQLDEFLNGEFIPLFESNRGCPFSCSYCNWGGLGLREDKGVSAGVEISEMLGNVERHLIAVQTFDPKVQESTGRANIRQEEIPSLVRELKEQGGSGIDRRSLRIAAGKRRKPQGDAAQMF